MTISLETVLGLAWLERGALMVMHAIVIGPLTSHPYKAGTEHVGVSLDQARTQSPSAGRRGVLGEGKTEGEGAVVASLEYSIRARGAL